MKASKICGFCSDHAKVSLDTYSANQSLIPTSHIPFILMSLISLRSHEIELLSISRCLQGSEIVFIKTQNISLLVFADQAHEQSPTLQEEFFLVCTHTMV